MAKSNNDPKKNQDENKRSSIEMQSSKGERKRSSADRTKQNDETKRPNKEDQKSSEKLTDSTKKSMLTPRLENKDPTIPSSIPTTSKNVVQNAENEEPRIPHRKRFLKYIYNRENKTYCGRTCKTWISIISYSIMYLIFLSTYTLIFLFFSLLILKSTTDFQSIEKPELLTYGEHGIGLTAIPTSETNYPLIWYQNGQTENYQKYVNALDKLLSKNRRKREVVNGLGPCGEPPYGYGDKPCIIIKINKQLKWAGEPLSPNSTIAKKIPPQVQRWLSREKRKLWLHCSGYHSYDKEHIGNIRYYPDPPGFDPDVFPLDMKLKSPLVAIQVTDFTLGISLAIECKLWYDKGPSSVDLLLYVAPEDKIVSNRTNFS